MSKQVIWTIGVSSLDLCYEEIEQYMLYMMPISNYTCTCWLNLSQADFGHILCLYKHIVDSR